MFEKLSRCMDLTGRDIVAAAQSSTAMRALLQRFSVIATPGKGAPLVLGALARLGTTACDWLDGELEIELKADDEHTVISVATSVGAGFREKLFPDTRLHARFEEFSRAISLTPKLVQPLVVHASAGRIVLKASSEIRKTSLPPPMIVIDPSSFLGEIPPPRAPRSGSRWHRPIRAPRPPSDRRAVRRSSSSAAIARRVDGSTLGRAIPPRGDKNGATSRHLRRILLRRISRACGSARRGPVSIDDATPSPTTIAEGARMPFGGSLNDEQLPASGARVYDEVELQPLLDYLQHTRELDVDAYKRSTLSRRLQRRMEFTGMPTCDDYVAYLERHPTELPELFDTILVNVTGFFRDEAAWRALATHVPRLLAARAPDQPIRVWSAGCASGEEVYTLAMLLAEALGDEGFANRVKIFATDVDQEALAQGRKGAYARSTVEAIPRGLRDKYFTCEGGTYTVRQRYRRAVIFGPQDVTRDAPISSVDILCCRNTLMYFNAETQRSILERLHFALAKDGLLFLGKAEMLVPRTDLFSPIDAKQRIFARVPAALRPSHWALVRMRRRRDIGRADDELKAAAFVAAPYAQLIVDNDGRLLHANARAVARFDLDDGDLGRKVDTLTTDGRTLELGPLLDSAHATLRPLEHVERAGEATDDAGGLRVLIQPLLSKAGAIDAMHIAFPDAADGRRFARELRVAHAAVEAASSELQATRGALETRQEELRSTVEELEVAVEELQSSNEQLVTMTRELEGANEELQRLSNELTLRAEELRQSDALLGALIGRVRDGIVYLDDELRVQVWNERMSKLWGLEPREVKGKPLASLDVGLPVASLEAPLRACLRDQIDAARVVDALDGKGSTLRCRVKMAPMSVGRSRGVLLLVEEVAP